MRLVSSSVCRVLKFCSSCFAHASVLMVLERFKVLTPVSRTFEKLTSLEKNPEDIQRTSSFPLMKNGNAAFLVFRQSCPNHC